jgi:hypothetical protein
MNKRKKDFGFSMRFGRKVKGQAAAMVADLGRERAAFAGAVILQLPSHGPNSQLWRHAQKK